MPAAPGLEKIISARARATSIGFGATVAGPDDRKTGEIFREAEPEDLLKCGLIPEFVGRLPVVATLEDLDAWTGPTSIPITRRRSCCRWSAAMAGRRPWCGVTRSDLRK
jgi:hypothetical protein